MISLDESALICDFAETYHILDYRALPLKLAAVLACGLRDDSRIKMKLAGMKLNPETMLLLFKSWPIQQLMKRGCSGTILCGILPAVLEHVDLPVVNPQVQKVLAAKVRESFALRAESKRLLDLAKHAVEVAIEQGEEKAIAML